jgi:hypothetical protein
MVHAEKKTHVEAAKFCAEKEGTLLMEGSSAGVALAKEKGAEDIWMGALDAKDADKEKAFVCEANCHDDKWRKLKFGKCKQYFLASAKKSHADAAADCKAKGAILFEPKSELTNTWVAELALEEGISGYWIGVHDKKFEGKFAYQSSGKAIGFHWWDRRQPNNKKNNCDQDEDCVYASNGEGEWQDLCCKKEQSYVCEKPATHCSHEEHCIPEKKNLGNSIDIKRAKMGTVETTTTAQKLETAALKKAMDNQKAKLDSQVMYLTQQKEALGEVNTATDKHHQAIEDLKKCLEKVEKSRDEQKATIDKLNTVTTKVTTATNVLKDATTKQHAAFIKLKTVTETQHKAIEAAENASKMVVNYWTILKACEEAVRRKNGHGSDVKAEAYGYGR